MYIFSWMKYQRLWEAANAIERSSIALNTSLRNEASLQINEVQN